MSAGRNGCLLALVAVVCLARPDVLGAQAAEPGTLRLDGDEIHYEVSGERELVVLLHDGLTHAGLWDAQFRRYAESFRVVRYDRRGHGRSDVPDAPYSQVSDLRALLDHLRAGAAVLIGASGGGRIALDFAAAHPDRVSALVLVGPVVTGYGYSDHFVERGRRNMAPLAEGDVAAAVSNWVRDPYLVATEDPAVRERLRRLLEPHADRRFRRHDPGLAVDPANPTLGRLEALDVPTLIIVGERDIPDVHAHAGAIDSRLPDVRRVVLPGAGHLVPLERPAAFDRLVLEFLLAR